MIIVTSIGTYRVDLVLLARFTGRLLQNSAGLLDFRRSQYAINVINTSRISLITTRSLMASPSVDLSILRRVTRIS